jgi:hypothetical protein
VFTLPAPLATLALQNKRLMYDLLFQATAETLQSIAADPKRLGVRIGFFCILHSWGQTLTHHPHLHCVVPGGGISLDGSRWVGCRPRFLLPVRVLSSRFRRLYLRYLEQAYRAGKLRFHGQLQHLSDPASFARYLAPLRKSKWVVYAKPPFGGPERVLDYLGRYTHRVAISNSRLQQLEDGQVTFSYKDYKDGHQQKLLTLSADEFLRRFLLHVLPEGFQRIRHYGLFSNRHRAENLARCRELLGVSAPAAPPPQDYCERYRQLTGQDLFECPQCQKVRCGGSVFCRPAPQPPHGTVHEATLSAMPVLAEASCRPSLRRSLSRPAFGTPRSVCIAPQMPFSSASTLQNTSCAPLPSPFLPIAILSRPPLQYCDLSKHIARGVLLRLSTTEF